MLGDGEIAKYAADEYIAAHQVRIVKVVSDSNLKEKIMSFLQQVRALTLGSVHDLLDKRIDENSPTIIRQYIRDLEDALGHMQNDAAVQGGQIRTMEREVGDITNKIALNKSTIEKILSGTALNKNDLARTRAIETAQLQKSLLDKQSQLETQRQTSANMDKAVQQVQAKHDLMVQQVRDLERLDRDSKSREQAARTLQNAGAILNSGSSISVDDISSKMRARNDVATEKFDRAMGSVKVEEDPNLSSDADAILAELAPKPVTA